ncbi:helix-turn-helix transcriptional regulator [Amycolatopsis lurida]
MRSADTAQEVLVTVREEQWFDAIGRVALAALRRGVPHRVVVPNHAGQTLEERVAGLSVLGADVRTVPRVPLNAMVIDRSQVMLPSTRAGASAAAVDLESVVAAATGVFEHLWLAGTPFAGGRLSARERRMLSLLAAGYADESIAVRMGVSVRTVRRMISTVMDRLGARSRFQAGARAAKSGWLGDDPP